MSNEEILEKGIGVTREAIEAGDCGQLTKCLNRFHDLGVKAEQLGEVLGDCPISLLQQCGVQLTIKSELLSREITLGKDLGWEELSKLLVAGCSGSDLRTIIKVKDVFPESTIIETTSLSSEAEIDDGEVAVV